MDGPELKSLLKKHRWSQRAFAKELGVARKPLAQRMNGHIKINELWATAILCKLGECEGKK